MNRFVLAFTACVFVSSACMAGGEADEHVDSINSHFSRGVSPDENAVILVIQAFGPRPEGVALPDEFFARLGIAKPPADGNYFVPFNNADQQEQFNAALEGLWSREDCPAVVEWMEANRKPVDLFIEGIQRPKWYSPIVRWNDEQGRKQNLVLTLLPAVQEMRAVARLLAARAHLALHEERFEDAWADILNCHRLGRMQSRGPTIIDYLVGVAITSIADSAQQTFFEHATVDSKTMQAMQQQWQSLPACADLSQQIQVTEKAMVLDLLDGLKNGDVQLPLSSLGSGTKAMSPAAKQALKLVDWKAVKALTEASFNEAAKLLQINSYELRTEKLDEWKREITSNRQSQLEQTLIKHAEPGKPSAALNQAVVDALLNATLPMYSANRWGSRPSNRQTTEHGCLFRSTTSPPGSRAVPGKSWRTRSFQTCH